MSWQEWDDTREQKERLQLELAKRRKRGETLLPFEVPEGKNLTKTFWGGTWCRHLETYAYHASRLPRGRSYLRQGNVYNLIINGGIITAEVAGSYMYEVEIRISPLPVSAWAALKKKCQGQVESLLDLLTGKLGDSLMQAVTDPLHGLFPKTREIHLSCTCPDAADLCKHCGAVLYGTGVLFDRDPKLFFDLRRVNPAELIATSAQSLTKPAADISSPALDDAELSALFGIDLAPPGVQTLPESAILSKPAAKKAVKKAVRKAVKKAPKQQP